MRPGDVHLVEIDGLTPTGAGLGRVGAVVVEVAGAFPGELAQIRVEHVSRQQPHAIGRLRSVERAQPQRRAVSCPSHRDADGGSCCGCPLLGLEAEAQREIKRAVLAREQGIAVDRVEGDAIELGYRWSSKRVVARRRGRLVLGSYAARSHHVAAMDGCVIEHPRIVRALAELASVANRRHVSVYDERTGLGELRYVWCKTDGQRVLLTLIAGDARCPSVESLGRELREPAGVWLSVQDNAGNAMRGTRGRRISGVDSLPVNLAGVVREIGPLGFLQPNPRVIASAYQSLVNGPKPWVPRASRALDLYAGLGVTTELLRRRYADVAACEAFPERDGSAKGIETMTAEAFLPRQLDAGPVDLVVANPPRAGLGERVCQQLQDLAPQRIHIMSCHPTSLARDLGRLERAGYRRVGARAYDALPQTAHLEVVVWLEREDATGSSNPSLGPAGGGPKPALG
ncbi:MAG: class I SAM-dependent RNA methyltransferase [Myxococcales bacterium FL481]|nr:MAG: class I SAM-dependent RNA methyltransferase [Myxococcales bacterium FL481]